MPQNGISAGSRQVPASPRHRRLDPAVVVVVVTITFSLISTGLLFWNRMESAVVLGAANETWTKRHLSTIDEKHKDLIERVERLETFLMQGKP